MRRAGCALLLAILSLSCVTYERGTFAALSTTQPPIPMTTVAEQVEGRACGSLFEAPLPRAVDDAIKRAQGANALVEARYGMENLCMVVRGRAVRIH